MKYQSGQSLIELLIAMSIFILAISIIAFLVLDAYVANRSALERTQATFLAEEGLEKARASRDLNWQNLVSIDSELIDNKFTRTVTVQEISPNRKQVVSQVSWQLVENRPQEVNLITYLTNWQAIVVLNCNTVCQNNGYSGGSCKPAKACKGTPLGGLGEYQCPPNRICCCQ